MADAPYTGLRHAQYRGPSTSEDYNDRIEENYQDLTVLYNRARLAEEKTKEYQRRSIKDNIEMARTLSSLEARVETLEAAANRVMFYDDSQIDTDRFNSTGFNIPTVNRLSSDSKYGLVTLPKVVSSSLSKLTFTDNNGETRIPSTLETSVVQVSASADSTSATIDTSLPEFAIRGGVGRVWERNVIAGSSHANGAMLSLYIRVPTDLFTTESSNVFSFDPFPLMGVDIMGISYTSKVNPVLDVADGYTPLANGYYSGNTYAIGWIAPGAVVNDAILDAAPKKFYFDPRLVTAIKVDLRRRSYYTENGNYVYTYGASGIDLGYDKFLATGKTIIRIDAPDADTISSVTSINPQLFNVAESQVSDVYSYRTIWETSFNSGTYTTTPVALSRRVWIEITLNQTVGGGTPALSGLSVTYT